MTIGELIKSLEHFPTQFQVFFCPSADGKTALELGTVVMNLVDPIKSKIIDDDDSENVPRGFIDSVVIYEL